MKKIIIDRYWKTIEIDPDDVDPMFQQHCCLCLRRLFPAWQDPNFQRTISDEAVCAVCWKCSMYGPDKMLAVPTVEEQQEEKKEERKLKQKEYQKRHIPKKKRDKAVARSKDIVKPKKRPCGCGARGRHKSSCSLSKKEGKA